MAATEDAYEKNTKEQYEALGRFVEAFELMVNEARMTCIEICDPSESGLLSQNPASVALLHQSITAKPIFEIMRAMIAETVKWPPTNPHYEDQEAFKTILGQLQAEYEALANKRNDLLHGTWIMGYRGVQGSADYDDAGRHFFLQRFRTSADGLVQAKKLPKDAKELIELATKCEKVRQWIAETSFCLRTKTRITNSFIKQEKRWILKLNDGSLVSLSEK